jgi:hypothetical protein
MAVAVSSTVRIGYLASPVGMLIIQIEMQRIVRHEGALSNIAFKISQAGGFGGRS